MTITDKFALTVTERVYPPGDSFGKVVRYTVHQCWIEFTVFPIVGVDAADSTPLFRGFEHGQWVTTVDEAVAEFSGHVKWDGRIEFSFENPVHYCDGASVEALGQLLKHIYSRSHALMGTDSTEHPVAGGKWELRTETSRS